ncbi:ABC transporter permease [Streptomyces sp. NPDC056480]|uniref:ABC transporter permease n=1 Tax=Streptomyces sp. NPDC056480 TaxID=3345833 RepID=UPI0036A6BC7B
MSESPELSHEPVYTDAQLTRALHLLRATRRGRWSRMAATLTALMRDPRGATGMILLLLLSVIAFFAPALAPQDPNATSSFSTEILATPSAEHWLGTDENGRDVLSQLLLGSQASMLVGLAAAVVSTVIGTAVGVASAWFGGITDRLLTILDDWFLVLPLVPVAVLAAALLGNRASQVPLGQTGVLIAVIGMFGWAGTSRIVRAEVLSLKGRAFVERARVLGAGNLRLVRQQLLPNLLPLVLANAVIYVSLAILTESTLSYLGLGDPNRFSWGGMLESAQSAGALTSGAWAYFIPPGLCIALAVLAFSLLGHAIEHHLDPRLGEHR